MCLCEREGVCMSMCIHVRMCESMSTVFLNVVHITNTALK